MIFPLRLVNLLYLLILPIIILFFLLQLYLLWSSYQQWGNRINQAALDANSELALHLARDPIFQYFYEDRERGKENIYQEGHLQQITLLFKDTISLKRGIHQYNPILLVGLNALNGVPIITHKRDQFTNLISQKQDHTSLLRSEDKSIISKVKDNLQTLLIPVGIDKNGDKNITGNERQGYLILIFQLPTEKYLQQVDTLLKQQLLNITLFTLLLLLAIYMAGRIIGNPIKYLFNHLQKNTSQGQWHPLNTRTRISEVNQLAAILNQFNVEVTFRELEVTEARDNAIEAAKTKGHFLATVSHELRTPINGIVGFSQLLHQTDLNHTQKGYLEKISLSAKTLHGLIDDVLDITRYQSGHIELDDRPLDLLDLIEDALSMVTSTAYAKGIEIYRIIELTPPLHIHGDSKRLRQIILNLLNNAVKFTEAGYVLLRLQSSHDKMNTSSFDLTISDTGIGIAEDQIASIFDPFTQSDSSIQRRFGGSGLGLAITRQLVEAMGGEIEASSQIEIGSNFRVTLPFMECTLPPSSSITLPPIGTVQAVIYDPVPLSLETLATSFQMIGIRTRSVQDPLQFSTSVQNTTERSSMVLAVIGLHPERMSESQNIYSELPDHPRVIHLIVANDHELQGLSLSNSYPLARIISRQDLLKQLTPLLDPQLPINTLVESVSSSSPLTNRSVLVVDDNEINLLLAEELLNAEGARVTTAKDGHDAVNKAKSDHFDLILMDVQMPKMSGLDATKLIRTLEEHRHTPIIALTAHVFAEQHQECIDAGMDSVVTKPFSMDDLIHDIKLKHLLDLSSHISSPNSAAFIEEKPVSNFLDSIAESEKGEGKEDTHLPFDALRAARQHNNRTALSHKVWNMFVSRLPEYRQNLENAWQTQDMEALQQHEHGIKGMAANCAATNLESLLSQLDREIKLNQYQDVQYHLQKIYAEIDRIIQFGPL